MVRQIKKLRKALNCFNDDSLWSECGIEEKNTLKKCVKKIEFRENNSRATYLCREEERKRKYKSFSKIEQNSKK
jgi:hypothetical protein